MKDEEKLFEEDEVEKEVEEETLEEAGTETETKIEKEGKEEGEEYLFEKKEVKKPLPARPERTEMAEKLAPTVPASDLELSIKTIAEYVKKQLAEIKSKAVSRTELKEDVANLRRSMLPHIEKLESKISDLKAELKEKSTDDLERKVEKLERQIEHVQELRSRHGELEKKLTDIHETIGKRALKTGDKDKDIVDVHLKRVTELEKKLENMGRVLSKGTSGVILSKLKSEMEEQIDDIKKEVDAKMKYVDQRLEEKPLLPVTVKEVKTDDKALALLKAEMDGLKKSVHGLQETKEAKDVEHLKEKISELEKTVSGVHTTFEKLKEVKGIEGYKDLVEDVHDVRKAIDEESALRASFDKRITDISVEMKNMLLTLGKLKHLEQIDLKKITAAYEGEKRLEAEVEKKMHEEAAKLVTKYMDGFAKVMDKRLPQLATKDDLARLESKLSASVAKKPLMVGMPVDKRIELLERKLNELVAAMRGFKSPFVIE